MFKIIWGEYANISLEDEVSFILRKWNFSETKKFLELVEATIQLLSTGIYIGEKVNNFEIYKLVISKQTTVYYQQDLSKNTIELLLFWNNKKDPKALKAILLNY